MNHIEYLRLQARKAVLMKSELTKIPLHLGEGTYSLPVEYMRQAGQVVFYGHAALHGAKRALDKAKNPTATISAADLTTELIDIGHTTGAPYSIL
jgi:hypothetical protein